MRFVDCGQRRAALPSSPPVERGKMLFIGKARHGVVGLRLEPRADEPSLGMNAQHRQPAEPA